MPDGTLFSFPEPEEVVVVGASHCILCHAQIPGSKAHTCAPLQPRLIFKASWRTA